MTALRLIVGLGNPGEQYARTRHNAGFWFVEALASQHSVTLRKESKFSGLCGRLVQGNSDCFLLMPQTYMNLSGQAVKALSHFYQISAAEILVVHDELDLPVGAVRFKQGGGHGGHNGLRSIIEHIGADFWRCRLGIGHPGQSHQVHDYVLHAPSQPEAVAIHDAITLSLSHLDDLLHLRMQKVMNAVNRKLG